MFNVSGMDNDWQPIFLRYYLLCFPLRCRRQHIVTRTHCFFNQHKVHKIIMVIILNVQAVCLQWTPVATNVLIMNSENVYVRVTRNLIDFLVINYNFGLDLPISAGWNSWVDLQSFAGSDRIFHRLRTSKRLSFTWRHLVLLIQFPARTHKCY